MRDQIVDTDGKPVPAPVEAYNAELAAACFPLMTAAGRMYTGITKAELFAGMIFAKHFNPADMDDRQKVVRLAERCALAAAVLAAEVGGER